MSKLGETFATLRGRGGLIAYVMGGDPDLESSRKVIEAVVRGGADIMEVGIPFSDPIADGKSIRAAGARALSSGTKPPDVLRLVAEVKEDLGVPVVLMTYYHAVFANGVGEFLDAARRSGVDGFVVPDLPLDEEGVFGKAVQKRGMDSILLATPTSSEERMKKIVVGTSGFLYLVSQRGVTGARRDLSRGTISLVKFARRFTQGKVPLAVGFGISRPEHVKAVVEAGADAAIVGSAIVDLVQDASEQGRGLEAVTEYVRSLKDATNRRA